MYWRIIRVEARATRRTAIFYNSRQHLSLRSIQKLFQITSLSVSFDLHAEYGRRISNKLGFAPYIPVDSSEVWSIENEPATQGRV